MSTKNKENTIVLSEFEQVYGIISLYRSRALQAVNNDNLLSAWEVGAFVSKKIKNATWGSNTVTQLSEYLRSQDPTMRGYSRRNIYNMVAFYENYSSHQFIQYTEKLELEQFVQLKTMQLRDQPTINPFDGQIVQFQTAQLQETDKGGMIQFPYFLSLTSFTNHIEILNACSIIEERIFYILYSHKERLNIKELKRCIKNNTFASLTSEKQNLSKGLKSMYPQTPAMFKDKVFLDFLGLPERHSEKRLQKGILDNLKDFILELGKDFLFVDKEYPLQVGNSIFKIDLLFFHRGLQCLIAIELKTTKFKPEYMGQLEFYLEALDRDVRRSNENPSIGMLLCQESDRSVVEYAMSRSLSPTMVAKYHRQLIPKEVLQRSLEEFIQFLKPKK